MRTKFHQYSIIALCLLLVFLTARLVSRTPYDAYLDLSPDKQRTYIPDPDAHMLFLEIYKMTNLVTESAYLKEKNLTVELRFSPLIQRDEVRQSFEYFGKLLFDEVSVFTGLPFQSVKTERNTFSSATLRVFVGDELLIYKHYDLAEHKEAYYENMGICEHLRPSPYSDESLGTPELQQAVSTIKDIQIYKPFKPYVYFIEMNLSTPPSAEILEQIKRSIVESIAPKLEKAVSDRYGTVSGALGIVVQIKAGIQYNHEFVLYNGAKKQWIDTPWMDTDFYSLNKVSAP